MSYAFKCVGEAGSDRAVEAEALSNHLLDKANGKFPRYFFPLGKMNTRYPNPNTTKEMSNKMKTMRIVTPQ